MLGAQHDAFAINAYNSAPLIRFDLASHNVSWQIDGHFLSGMAVVNGKILDVNSGALEVRDEQTGNVLWTWTPPVGHPVTSNIVVTDSHIFVATVSATYAIDWNSHVAVWTTSFGAAATPNFGGGLAIADDWLYIQSQDFNSGIALLEAIQLAPVPEPSAGGPRPVGLVKPLLRLPLPPRLSTSAVVVGR
jgi:hypothetical protein